jgi:hypothetical protein
MKGDINMNETFANSQSQALSSLEKAEGYKKLGLKAEVRHELEQAKRIDPYIIHEARYKALLEESTAEPQVAPALKTPLRIGAGMLFVNALISMGFLILILASGDTTGLGGGDFAAPIVNVVIGVNLWQVKEQWKRYTVWWALIGLVLFGVGSLASGDYFGLIAQIGFSGSLILLLAGTPSNVRTTAAVVIYLVGYIGLLCLIFTLSFLGTFAGTG